MGKPIAILAVGIFLMFMGCRTMSGYDTEIEHLYAGRTETVVCSGGKPVEGRGLEARTAIDACTDERRRQSGATRILFVLGLLTAGYGGIEVRKLRKK